MKQFSKYAIAVSTLLLFSCHKSTPTHDEQIVSQRFLHRYGYDVSKKEWNSATYPGTVLTTLRNGITINESYSDGVLHGTSTYTFPHSNTIEITKTFEKGTLIKTVSADIRGIPIEECLFLSPTHIKKTKWFKSGTPMSIEETHNKELLESEYFDTNHEIIHRVSKGKGTRISRNQHEKIVKQESIDHGRPNLVETFYPHGNPHTSTGFSGSYMHGDRTVFAPSGEPISAEPFYKNKLHGTATYYQNGCKYLEIQYDNGLKQGIERHFLDGETIIEETRWLNGQKHGESIVFFDGMSHTHYFYNNRKVSKEQFRELNDIEINMSIMSERASRKHSTN